MSFSARFRNDAANAASRRTQSNYQNGLVTTITKGTPVATNLSGQIVGVDVSDEASIGRIMGLAYSDIPSAATGPVVDAGRFENLTTSFSIGDALYIGKTGALINQKPDIGVAGFVKDDFIVFVGVVTQNEFNPLQKDIKLMIGLVGQL